MKTNLEEVNLVNNIQKTEKKKTGEQLMAELTELKNNSVSYIGLVRKISGGCNTLKKSMQARLNEIVTNKQNEEANKASQINEPAKTETKPSTVVGQTKPQTRTSVQGVQQRTFAPRTEGFRRPQNGTGTGFNRPAGTGETRMRRFDLNAQGDRPRYGQNGTRQFGERKPYAPNAGANGSARPMQSRTQLTRPAPIQPANDNRRVENKTAKKKDHGYDEKKSLNRKALMMRGFVDDESLFSEDGHIMGSRKIKGKKAKQEEVVVAPKIDHAVITTENLTVKMLAEKIGKPVVELIKKFMVLGIMVNINSTVDFDSAELVASEFGVKLEQKLEKSYEEKMFDISGETDDEKDLVKRPPIVTVLGHVDHGKTSLLDYIRDTSVVAGEAGGITQHIGAYTITKNNELITFIDTPGHAAFGAMRERGAKLTDIAILVVAADDGVMPQTVEAIKYIKEAKVPMIVAINKIDKPEANIDRIKQQLTEHDVVPEEWGGDAILVPISAKTGQNVDKLLEMVLFVAEYQNLRANPKRRAIGSVVEAQLDKGKGPVATILVQNGTLKVGDVIIAGTSVGKVRAMFNEKGKNVKSAGPSFAVSVLGLSSVPNAGDEMYAVDEKMSKKVLSERVGRERNDMIKATDNSVESLMNRFKETEFKSYNVIIKADVQGSVEALKDTIGAICNEEVKVRCIHGGVGAVNENDIMLASASNALIIAFNVKQDFKAKVLSDKYKVNIQTYKIIYEAVDYVTKQINAMLTPKFKEVVSGHAELRMIFKASKVGAIAGCYILDGKLTKNQSVRLLRKNKEVFKGTIATIQREKTEVKEILAGFECGIVLNGFSAFEVGDIIEGYDLERIN